MAGTDNEVGRIELTNAAGAAGRFTITASQTPGGIAYALQCVLGGSPIYESRCYDMDEVRSVWRMNLKRECRVMGYDVVRVNGWATLIESMVDMTLAVANEMPATPILF